MEQVVDLRKAVRVFGGYSALARRLDIPLSTCHGWHRSKKLPKWRADAIALLAQAEKKNVWKKPRPQA